MKNEEELAEFAARRIEKLESMKLPLITPDDYNYKRLKEELMYILNAPVRSEVRSKGNRVFSMLVSYLRSCQTGFDLKSLKEWHADYQVALNDASYAMVPSSEEEIDEFLNLAGNGLKSLYDHALATYRGSSKPVLACSMLAALYLIARTTKQAFLLITNIYGRLQIASITE